MKGIRNIIAGAAASAMLFSGLVASADSVHIQETLESPFLALKLDAEVEIPKEGLQMTVYETDFPEMSAESLARMFLNGEADSKDVILPIERGELYVNYFPEEARLAVGYAEGKEMTRWWEHAQINRQAKGIEMTPDQAVEKAQAWIDRLSETMGWGGYVLGGCYTMPTTVVIENDRGEKVTEEINPHGYYIVDFVKVLNGIPVAYDASPYLNDTHVDPSNMSDYIQFWIDDEGIWNVTASSRSYQEKNEELIHVSLNDAIAILKDNMDYVECYPDELPCVISEIGLCYRLIQTLPVSDKASAARVEVRPAWRFASRINRGEPTVFFMFVDAVTGEVLP